MHKSLYRWALLLACAASAASAGKFDGRLVVEDFEAFVWGEDWATVQFSPGADPRMKAERATVHSGRQACRLDVPPGETLTLVPDRGTRFVGNGEKPPLPLPGVPERIGLWVHGGHSGHRIWLRVLDAAGKTAELALGSVDFEGWRLLEARTVGLPAPLALRAITVRGGDGPLVLDDLTLATAAPTPLHLTLRPLAAQGDFVEGQPVPVLVLLQCLGEQAVEGTGEVAAFEAASPGVCAGRASFRFRASAAEPFRTTLRLRLPPGVHSLVARAGEAECSQRAVVHRAAPKAPERAVTAVRRFGRAGDALRVYESALSPALVVETTGDTLTLFRGLRDAGLRPPQHLLTRMHPERTELLEPWILLWFGETPEWRGVDLADGSPCPTFDVPFLVVFDQLPRSWRTPAGLELRFGRRGARAAVLPLLGVRRADPAETTSWQASPEALGKLAQSCRSWARLLQAVPVDLTEEYRVDAERDLIEVRVRFQYLTLAGRWGGGSRGAAPVPPLLMLARQAGLPVRFSKEPVATGCSTSVGPYFIVPDAEGYTYSISGLLRFVLRAVADVPPGVPGAQVSLVRNYRTLSGEAVKIPFWVAYGGAAGGAASDALARFMLSPANARFAYDAASGRLRAWDGLLAQTQGDAAAARYTAEFLQGCWYAGLHAGLWDTLRPRWRQVLAMRETLAGADDWATLGLGSHDGPADAPFGAALYFARLAARLGGQDDYARGCAQAVKLLVAAYALVAAAPEYTGELGPWPGLAGQQGRAIGRCLGGSVGFAAGPPPFVTTPSDAGYSFAAEFLGEYYREHFHGGPLDYFGRSPAEWSQRLFGALSSPDTGKRFRPASPPAGPFATNYVYSVEAARDGWPAMTWRSHRSPAGGPLTFGGIGAASAARGGLDRTCTVRPWLRLSAYTAIEAPPPPREATSQPPPPPKPPPSEIGPGIPDRSRP
ncbi:MAG TPA: hypothetical protein VNE39_16190 [Planctomycetota bacterium]|nr:hypothetical protein [Planctomycetota bacterium]